MIMARWSWRTVLMAVLFVFSFSVIGAAAGAFSPAAASAPGQPPGGPPVVVGDAPDPSPHGPDGGDPDDWEINHPNNPKSQPPVGPVVSHQEKPNSGTAGWLWDLWLLVQPGMRALGF